MLRHIFGILLLSGVASATPASQTVGAGDPLPTRSGETSADVECSSYPGRTLCRQIRRFNSLLVECTGSACYSLWNRQLRTARAIADYYYDEIDLGATVSEQLGDYAHRVARNLCGVKVTGDPNTVSNLMIHYNRLLDILEELQEGAEVETPYSCKFTID